MRQRKTHRSLGFLLKLSLVPISLQLLAGEGAAQDRLNDPPPPVRFGVLDPSLFQEEPGHDYPFEFLQKNVTIRFRETAGRIEAVLEYHNRIRVLSDDPVHWAEAALVGIPWLHDSELEEITGIEGATHLPDGTIIPLDPAEVRTVEYHAGYRISEFIMPGVRKGSILEYRYRIHRRWLDELPDFFLSARVPVRSAHVAIHNEEYIRYEVTPSNVGVDLHHLEELTDTSSLPRVFTLRRPEPVSVEHWIAREIPPVGEEIYISSLADLSARLHFQMSEFGRPRQPLENSWEWVVAQIRRGRNNPYDWIRALEPLRELGRGMARDGAEWQEIFRYLNRSVTFNGVHRAFPENSWQEIGEAEEWSEPLLGGEPADQATINLMLLALLDGAGVDAHPVYLSGRDAGRINPLFPSLFQFTQMIVAVQEADGSNHLVDASWPDSRPGLIPVGSWNRTGLELMREGFRWVEVRPESSRFVLDLALDAELSEYGELSGKIRIRSEGYPAREMERRLRSTESPAEVIQESFFSIYSDAVIESAQVEPAEREGEVALSARFRIPGYGYSFREGLQFQPLVIGHLFQNPFPGASRTVPVTLDAPERLDVKYRISLPPGYGVEQTRGSEVTRITGAELREEYRLEGRELNYTFGVRIDRVEYSPDEYRDLRRFYNRWVELSNEQWFVGRSE